MPGRRHKAKIAAAAVVAAALVLPATAAAAELQGFRNVLPPAEGRNANAADVAAFEANGTYPAHTQDQLNRYHDLMYGVGANQGLKASEIPNYYKDAGFGAQGSTESPRNDVTITRDSFGVPHIEGTSRAGAMFGAGYVAAEDRLFFIDVLRNAARATLASFAGGSNTGMDESIWSDTPYRSDAELQQQYDNADDLYGAQGVQIQTDVTNYVDGIDAFITQACANPLLMPGEYALINQPGYPCTHMWHATDVIAIASLVAGVFGKGGGGELGNAIRLQSAQAKFGKHKGRKVWTDFQAFNDPEAPTTIHNKSFPYDQPPKHPRGLAMPDPGSVQYADVVESKSSNAPPSPASHSATQGEIENILAPFTHSQSASNALLVSGRESKTGRPLAVMGPQVGYWSPEILMEESIKAPAGPTGPAVAARGASFPGTNLYVQLGHGTNYAWSATSAGQDIIDTYAVKLCEPGGGAPSMDSTHYVYGGQCLPFETLTRTNSWTPSAGDQTAAGSETLRTLRSKLGIVIARATIDGKPYAYTQLRDTYFHEVDPSVLGFAEFNEPQKMETPKDFQAAACNIAYTFNWFYVNQHHIAYFNSGQNPVRPPGVDGNLPTLGKKRFVWRGWNPQSHTEKQTSCNSHPHITDQRFLSSWNNRQAHDYGTGWTSMFRSDLLDERIKADIRGAKKITLAQLIADMEDAGSADLRGDEVLPLALRVIKSKPVSDPAIAQAVKTLSAWQRTGAHRRDLNKDGTYEDSTAVRIMDAWWPRMTHAIFDPTLGSDLADQFGIAGHDSPGRIGSAFDTNSYGYSRKDLRTILGQNVKGPYSRIYCGKGKLGKCRDALTASLGDALAHDSDGELYGGSCTLGTDAHPADPQACHDAIGYRAIGAIAQPLMPWINRPTFQQAVEIHK
jgi:acyl-homoserine lactone acylase PvdQ